MNNKKSRTLAAAALGALIGLCWAHPVRAAQVAPNVVFIDSGERGSEITVRNGGERPIEVEVRVVFGYEASDAEGRTRTVYPGREAERARSAADWIRAYPQRAVIPPNSRQTIRLFSRPPRDLEAGEYWARVEVQSRPTHIPTETLDDAQDVQVRIGVATRQRIPLFVRIGETEASLRVGSARARLREEPDEDGVVARELQIRYRASLAGNAAFLGSLTARVENGSEILAERTSPLAVFVPGVRRIRVPLPAGVSEADLRGATLVLEPTRQHPAIQARYLVSGRALRWEGPLALE